MIVKRFVNSFFTSNTWLIAAAESDAECWLVDCGDWEPVAKYIGEHSLRLRGVLLTHGHYDHIYGLNDMAAAWPKGRVYASAHCIEELYDVKLNYSKYHEREFVYAGTATAVADGSIIPLWDGSEAEVIASPGHDSGHMAYRVGQYLFTGDAYIPGTQVVTHLRGNASQAAATVDMLRGRIATGTLTTAPGHGELTPCIYNYYIIGARGFGRENCRGLMSSPQCGVTHRVAGFLDDNPHALDGYEGYPPIVSSLEDFYPTWGDLCVLALGDPSARRKYGEMALAKGCYFPPNIHPTAIVDSNARIGQGVVIGPYCTISPDVEIGDFCVIHPYCNLGHDVRIGRYCSVESYTFLGGGVQVDDNVAIHTRATLIPHIKVGEGAVIGVGSVVLRSVKAGITVFGNPARRVEF